MQADLYFGRIDVRRHLPQPGPECRDCDAASCRSFAARLESGRLVEEARLGPLPAEACPLLGADRLHAFRIALAPEVLLPAVEVVQLPRPVEAGRTPLGDAGPDAPVVVSANHQGTVEVVGALLGLTSTPLNYVVVDTRGDSVDMAMILGTMTAQRVAAALGEGAFAQSRRAAEGEGPRVLLPGFAAALAGEVTALTGARVDVGPICAAELPLYLGEAWRAAG